MMAGIKEKQQEVVNAKIEKALKILEGTDQVTGIIFGVRDSSGQWNGVVAGDGVEIVAQLKGLLDNTVQHVNNQFELERLISDNDESSNRED